MYSFIAQDPPRWLDLAFSLQSKPIFREAPIHCAGGFPAYKWPTPIDQIHVSLRPLVFHKAKILESWVKDISLELLRNVFESPTSESQFVPKVNGPRLIVHIFRDWLSGEQRSVMSDGTMQFQDGSVFRKLAQGEDTYLTLREATAMINMVWNKTVKDPQQIESCLAILKDFAKQLAAPMAANHLMIDPLAHQIPYITCTEVNELDMLWLST